MNSIQKIIDAMSASSRNTRSDYHVTLFQMIETLESVDKSLPVIVDVGGYIGSEDSYRGYYSDLSFRPSSEISYCDDVLSRCKKALDSEYEGYKGGDFLMDKSIPLWIAEYGSIGRAIIDIEVKGEFLGVGYHGFQNGSLYVVYTPLDKHTGFIPSHGYR